MNKPGRLIVISAPSGGGKTAVLKEVQRRRPDLVYSVSSTTRPCRNYEKNGIDYNFISTDEFQKKIDEGKFIEWAEVHGFLYGTDRDTIERLLEKGKYILLDIDVNGGMAIYKLFSDAILIFLHAPSIDELRRRLKSRGSENDASIENRLQRYQHEKKIGDNYPQQLVNHNLNQTADEVLTIIDNISKSGQNKQ